MPGSDTPRDTPDEPDVTDEIEAAVLEIIRTLPINRLHNDNITALLHAYATLLADNNIFAGLDGSDSLTVAEAIAEALCHPDPVASMLNMARDSAAGIGVWMNPAAVARAFSVAAAALR
jgi:hypothetical protein